MLQFARIGGGGPLKGSFPRCSAGRPASIRMLDLQVDAAQNGFAKLHHAVGGQKEDAFLVFKFPREDGHQAVVAPGTMRACVELGRIFALALQVAARKTASNLDIVVRAISVCRSSAITGDVSCKKKAGILARADHSR
jgi:hypothetical protein